MEWIKEIGPSGAAHGGMRGDLPLSHDLPAKIGIDCTRLLLPIFPMFGVRLRMFVDWHRHEGREIAILPPEDSFARRLFHSMQIHGDAGSGEEPDEDAVLPVTKLDRHNEAEMVAQRTQEILEYQLTDVSPLGQAAFMAVSELCDNAMDHGKNSIGAYVAVQRFAVPSRQVSIAIGDLGIGIPEHIRQRYPEWSDDSAAIAHATEPTITGTGNPQRGIGFSAVMEAALTASLHAARMNIYSANGFFRLQVIQESRKPEIFPASNYRRGTWITYDLVSV
jgi:hypothetical protein